MDEDAQRFEFGFLEIAPAVAVIHRGIGDPVVVGLGVEAAQFQVYYPGARDEMVPFIGYDHFLVPLQRLIVEISQHLTFVMLLDPTDAVVKPEQIGMDNVNDLLGLAQPRVQEFLAGFLL